MAIGTPQKSFVQSFATLGIILFLTFGLFLVAATIILSLISIYLPKAGSNIVIYTDRTSTSFNATYVTSLANASNLGLSDSASLPTTLADQLHLSKSNNIQVLLSQFLPSSSSSKKKKRENTCDRDTDGMTGDLYITEVQVDDPTECRTQYCGDKFTQKIAGAAQLYPSLTLPFQMANGESITVSMVLCKFGELFSTPPTCTDNIQNLDETDVDCGGSTCTRRCAVNEKCLVTSDCSNATCFMGTCLGELAAVLAACEYIRNNISSASEVFYPSDIGYNESISHYVTSSIMYSVCSVEPGTTTDVATILKVVGQNRILFGIKGGGHSFNPGFSSTAGILIAMRRFRQVTYYPNNQTVDLGPGLIWDEVYQALEPFNISVIGGRVTGVGVAGLTLGGGYSWKSNQYGLGIDNVFEYELVAPNGTIVYVNNISYPDIFFGLKGGLNNFGIVTKFNVRAVPQTQVYGGVLYYSPLQFDALIQTIATFQANNTDPKAQIIASFIITPGEYVSVVILFYDAPTAPNDLFKSFMDLQPYGVLATQSYLSLVQASPSNAVANLRGRYSSVSVTQISVSLLQQINNQLLTSNSTLGSSIGATFIVSVEPFISTYLNKEQGGAYPHLASSAPLLPLVVEFNWVLPSDDAVFISEIKLLTNNVVEAAVADGQDVGGIKQIVYPNYALENTSLAQMYGSNVARLQSIRQAWDPENVMYLTGGFKF